MWKWRWLIRLLSITSWSPGSYDRRMRRLLACIQERVNSSQSTWLTYSAYAKQPVRHGQIDRSAAEIAIVMQGPLLLTDDFTLETVRHYRTTAPDSAVVVSTWNDQDATTLRALGALGATVICSQPPKPAGVANVNLQIASTREGLRAATELGFDYILKTRTDARIYAPQAGDFLCHLLRAFPLATHLPQRERILVLDLFTRLYIPCHGSDMLMFGHRDDLWQFWNVPYSPHLGNAAVQHGDFNRPHVPEVYLYDHYFQRIGYPRPTSLTSWWQALGDLFLVVDHGSLDYFWPKHNYVMNHRVNPDAHLRTLAVCKFRDWLNLMSGFVPQSPNGLERLGIDVPLTAA